MDENLTKTSTKQRIVIGIIAALMLISTVAVYIAIVLANSSSSSTSSTDTAKIQELSEQYTAKQTEVDTAAVDYSNQYFGTFAPYRSAVKAYNAETANSEGLKTNDLLVGSGTEIGTDDTNYFAYYIGWCADESIFDSSFNTTASSSSSTTTTLSDLNNATSLKAPLDPAMGMIDGWNQGVAGMKIGGIREITVPGELAYGDSQEICGGTNSPLKFVVMAVEKTEPLATLESELTSLYTQLLYAYYGISSQ